LLESGLLKEHLVSVLVRGEDKVKAFEAHGVTAIVFDGLDDSALLRRVAGEHDSV
jgi:hypothetical protein